MPAQSKAQQRFMGMVHAAQKGETPASADVAKVAKDIDPEDAKAFASTKHKGLPTHKETISKERLKELVKEVMVEEAEYQTFFKKALEKAGKSIPSMSDEEKKAFFDKIDSAWNGKGEKNEELVGGQKELDVDGDGDIEGDDLADLRAGKKANEDISTELPKATIPSAVKQKMAMAIDKIKDAKLTNVQKLQLVAQVVDSLGIDKSQLGSMASKIRSKMESVTEGVSSADMDKIKGAVEAAKSFMSVGAELKKLGMKYTFATEPLPIYIIQPTPNNKVAIVNKKYVSKPDFVVGDIAVGVMEGKSVKK
jgi:hypothetical protein